MMSNMTYTRRLIKYNILHFKISIHGQNHKVHDVLTNTNNSFEQTINGIINLFRAVAMPTS